MVQKVSDSGLVFLENLNTLQQLFLWDTKTTKKGVAILASKLPQLKIESGYAIRIE